MTIDVRSLVETSRVHGRLYTDPVVFEEELERIWYGSWVYIAHVSEVPRPGDYRRKRVGFQELVVNRDFEGGLHVFFNRCPHRGNLVTRDQASNSSGFRCPYHGWTFSAEGALIGVPSKDAYGERFEDVRDRLCLSEVEHLGTYAGFIFGALNDPGISLEAHLGPARFAFDQLVGLSPAGELDLNGGWLRHQSRCNWKIAVESFLDHYHPRFVHHSMFRATGATLEEMRANSVADLGGGHTELGFSHHNVEVGKPLAWAGNVPAEKLGDYVPAMEASYGAEEAQRRLIAGPPHVMVFPNLCIAQMNLIVFHPTSPSECVQETAPVLLTDAPELNRRTLRQCEGAMGPAGLIIADDAEIGERTQVGLMARSPEWLELSRGLERDRPAGDGVVRSPDESDETTHRGFWRHYADVITGRLE